MPYSDNLNHIAFIMDGNRRWATQNGLPKLLGHTQGVKTLRTIAKAVQKEKIPYMTVWALSTENLQNRSQEELTHLFSLIETLPDYLKDFLSDNVRCTTIGNLSLLPEKTQQILQEMQEKTKHHTDMTLTLAINYGGRDEILRAIKKLTNDTEVTQKSFCDLLDTHNLPDPDLIIRTGGHQRLSGFMPWQTTYSELYFTPTYWPAFTKTELQKALQWYSEQERNKGV